VAEAAGAVLAVIVFVGGYALLRRRSESRTGTRPPIQWAWLAAIIGCVAVALLAGAITH
jgi:hypothetical protein